jgi:hypothetical protein
MIVGLVALVALLAICLLWSHRSRILAALRLPDQGQAVGMLGDLLRSRSELVAENALLRQQLIVLRPRTMRPRFSRLDRLLLVLLARRVRTWCQALLIVWGARTTIAVERGTGTAPHVRRTVRAPLVC